MTSTEQNPNRRAASESHEEEQLVGVFHDAILMDNEPGTSFWSHACQMECDEFLKKGYLSDEQEYHKEYDPYDDPSVFVGIERLGKLVGVSRFIMPSEKGFMTINDARDGDLTISDEGWEELGKLDLNFGFEVATIAVPEEYRTPPIDPKSVSASIYAAVLYSSEKLSREQDREDRGFVIASFDAEYLDRFQIIFSSAVKVLGPPQDYKGSLTVPVLITPDTFMKNDHPDKFNDFLAQLAQLTQDHAN